MPTKTPNAEKVFQALCADATKRTQRSLTLIHDICSGQVERGSTDFSIATIGSLSEKRGGPSTQAIRNKTGEHYKALIAAWADQNGKPAARAQPRLTEDSWVEEIEKPNIRWLVRDRLSELKRLRGQVNILKSGIELNVDMRQKIESTSTPSAGLAAPATPALTASEVKALQHAISQQLLDDRGWERDQRGQILDENGRQVFKPGFATAIEKILTV